MKYFKKYEGDRIYLSPINIDDLELIVSWLNDETLTSGLGNISSVINLVNEKDYLDSQLKKGSNNFAIVDKETDTLLGIYGLDKYVPVSRRYHVGGFIGEQSQRGKGYGTEALKLVTKYAFEVINANSIYSTIHEFNIGSLKSALKAGYKEVGRYREAYYYNNKYYDSICIDIIRSDFYKN